MRRDEGEWPNLELATSIWPHNPTLRVPDKKGGSPAVSKNRGKGPPFAAFFVTAGAWGGTPQIVKKGVRRSQIHPADPKMGGFLPFLEKVALSFSGFLGPRHEFKNQDAPPPPFPGTPQVVKFQPQNGSNWRHTGAFSKWRMQFRPQSGIFCARFFYPLLHFIPFWPFSPLLG